MGGGAPSPAVVLRRRPGGVLVATNFGAIPPAVRDKGSHAGRGLVGPNMVLGAEAAGGLSSTLAEAPQVFCPPAPKTVGLWEGGEEPDLVEVLAAVGVWLGRGATGRVSDYLTAEEGGGEALTPVGRTAPPSPSISSARLLGTTSCST